MQHVYRKANGRANELAKRGTRQQNFVFVYSTCPSFVDVSYVRDLIDLGETRLCITSADANVV